MLIDGDGSLYQHIQELETVRRHSIKLLICIINDGGYGAETHKFRACGVDPIHATHGRGDLAQIARGFATFVGSTNRSMSPSDEAEVAFVTGAREGQYANGRRLSPRLRRSHGGERANHLPTIYDGSG